DCGSNGIFSWLVSNCQHHFSPSVVDAENTKDSSSCLSTELCTGRSTIFLYFEVDCGPRFLTSPRNASPKRSGLRAHRLVQTLSGNTGGERVYLPQLRIVKCREHPSGGRVPSRPPTTRFRFPHPCSGFPPPRRARGYLLRRGRNRGVHRCPSSTTHHQRGCARSKRCIRAYHPSSSADNNSSRGHNLR